MDIFRRKLMLVTIGTWRVKLVMRKQMTPLAIWLENHEKNLVWTTYASSDSTGKTRTAPLLEKRTDRNRFAPSEKSKNITVYMIKCLLTECRAGRENVWLEGRTYWPNTARPMRPDWNAFLSNSIRKELRWKCSDESSTAGNNTIRKLSLHFWILKIIL